MPPSRGWKTSAKPVLRSTGTTRRRRRPTSCSSAGRRCSTGATTRRPRSCSSAPTGAEPGKASILEALGRAYFNSGQHEPARATFEQLLELDPSAPYAHYALGQSLKRLGRRDEAGTHLRLAVALSPGSKLYRDALARLPSGVAPAAVGRDERGCRAPAGRRDPGRTTGSSLARGAGAPARTARRSTSRRGSRRARRPPRPRCQGRHSRISRSSSSGPEAPVRRRRRQVGGEVQVHQLVGEARRRVERRELLPRPGAQAGLLLELAPGGDLGILLGAVVGDVEAAGRDLEQGRVRRAAATGGRARRDRRHRARRSPPRRGGRRCRACARVPSARSTVSIRNSRNLPAVEDPRSTTRSTRSAPEVSSGAVGLGVASVRRSGDGLRRRRPERAVVRASPVSESNRWSLSRRQDQVDDVARLDAVLRVDDRDDVLVRGVDVEELLVAEVLDDVGAGPEARRCRRRPRRCRGARAGSRRRASCRRCRRRCRAAAAASGSTSRPAPTRRARVARALDRDVDEVHRRAADEARDEPVERVSYRVCGVPTCMSRPSFMTAIREPIVIASTWSWVT